MCLRISKIWSFDHVQFSTTSFLFTGCPTPTDKLFCNFLNKILILSLVCWAWEKLSVIWKQEVRLFVGKCSKKKLGMCFIKMLMCLMLVKYKCWFDTNTEQNFIGLLKILNQGKIILDEPYDWNWGNNFPKLVASVKAPCNTLFIHRTSWNVY